MLGNYAIIDTKITVIGGSTHETDSSEMAFRSAAVMALRSGVNAATPILLEPIMLLEISSPDEHVGDVMEI